MFNLLALLGGGILGKEAIEEIKKKPYPPIKNRKLWEKDLLKVQLKEMSQREFEKNIYLGKYSIPEPKPERVVLKKLDTEEEKEIYLRRMIELCVEIYEKNVHVLFFLSKTDIQGAKANTVYYAFPIEAKQWSREERVEHIIKQNYTKLHIKYMRNFSSDKVVPWEEREATIDTGSNRIDSYLIKSHSIELRYSDGRIINVRVNERV